SETRQQSASVLHATSCGWRLPAKKLRTDNVADKHVFRAMNNVTVTCLWSDAKGCQVFVQYRERRDAPVPPSAENWTNTTRLTDSIM
ncbi:hypothetical protein KUCAC02_035119, partial [Chaenocephalus aceratus]